MTAAGTPRFARDVQVPRSVPQITGVQPVGSRRTSQSVTSSAGVPPVAWVVTNAQFALTVDSTATRALYVAPVSDSWMRIGASSASVSAGSAGRAAFACGIATMSVVVVTAMAIQSGARRGDGTF